MQDSVYSNIKLIAENGIPVLITGPSGIGKTMTATKIARDISSRDDCIIIDAATLSEPEDWFARPVVTKEGIEWIPSRLVIEDDLPIVIDEINRVQNERVLNAILPILDFRKEIWIEKLQISISFGNRPVIATANIGWQFVGTVQLDAALLNRFAIIEMRKPEISSKYPFIERLTAAVKDAGYRNVEMAERLIELGIDERSAAFMAFRSVCETEELEKIINYVY